MSTTTAVKSVFVTFPADERDLARQVRDEFQQAGLETYSGHDIESGVPWEDYLREALKQAAAIVVILARASRRSDIPDSILFEIGAASSAEKPIHVFVGERGVSLPFSLTGMQIHAISDASRIARQIASV